MTIWKATRHPGSGEAAVPVIPEAAKPLSPSSRKRRSRCPRHPGSGEAAVRDNFVQGCANAKREALRIAFFKASMEVGQEPHLPH
jgi:hypothetical protein